MNQNTKTIPKSVRRDPNFNKALHKATQHFIEQIKTLTKEEMAEKLTTYEPGVPHYWFGRPVAPITKEELLAFWNGGPDIEPRYLDELPATHEKANAP